MKNEITASLPLSSKGAVSEICGRVTMVLIFSLCGIPKALAISALLAQWPNLDANQYLDLASHLASAAFIALVTAATLFRLKPIKSAEGIDARASALTGAFLSVLIVTLPLTDAGPAWRITAVSLVVIGWILSTWVLFWLGRSFSLIAQARRLVTTGPYAIVRHPLYLCEEIALVGVVMLHFSPIAVLIIVVQWLFQLRRMNHEESVLRSAFPDYDEYAARTPRVIPFSMNITGLRLGKSSPQ